MTPQLIHIAAENACKQLPVAVDELLIDIFFYLDKSSKRHQELQKFQSLYGTEVRKILKHVSTRWLSLGICLRRLLDQWEPLKEYFRTQASVTVGTVKKRQAYDNPEHQPATKTAKLQGEHTSAVKSGSASVKPPAEKDKKRSSSGTDKKSGKSAGSNEGKTHQVTASTSRSASFESRPDRVKRMLTAPQVFVYCLFLDNILPVFDKANLKLQHQSPQIHKLRRTLLGLLEDIVIRFVKASAIAAAPSVTELAFTDRSIQKDNEDLICGAKVRNFIATSDTFDKRDAESFYCSVRKFCETAAMYIVNKLPLKDVVLKHLELADVGLRSSEDVTFSNVTFLLQKFPALKPGTEEGMDRLEQQFALYQADKTLPESVLSTDRVDVQWHLIGQLKNCQGQLKYDTLSRFMLGLLVIPHSNAASERVFSLVRKNQTDFRPNMGQQLLQSILINKTNDSEALACHAKHFSEPFLRKAKKSTMLALAVTKNPSAAATATSASTTNETFVDSN